MSNYSSVILAFVAPPDMEDLGLPYNDDDEELNDGCAIRKAVEDAFARLTWRIDDTTWAHGIPAGDAYCCETVVRFCVNHFDPETFFQDVFSVAPWLMAEDFETQAWYKDEGDDSYRVIPIPKETTQ